MIVAMTTWLIGRSVICVALPVSRCPRGTAAARARDAGGEPADPLSDGAQNVRLVGYHDLQGRQRSW